VPVNSVVFISPSVQSVCPVVSTKLSLDGFRSRLILEISVKICQENPNLVTIIQKCEAVYLKTEVYFAVVKGKGTL
jgi:hypothetical protein